VEPSVSHPTRDSRRPVAVALTGYGRAEDRARTLEAGFQMHAVKPVEPAAIAAVTDDLERDTH
jgi:two-component system, chemotaxis family, CheB/CheR fusion protein